MRFRTKLFLMSSLAVLVLWACSAWPIQSTIESSFNRLANTNFAATRLSLHGLQLEHVGRMRQMGTMLMEIPELRALIAEHNFEVSAENLGSLRERLDSLASVMGVSFICVLDSRRAVIAQNSSSPWPNLAEVGEYFHHSAQARALSAHVFDGAQKGPDKEPGVYGLWLYRGRLFQVVGLPLVFSAEEGQGAEPDGAMVMATPITDDLAATLSKTQRCDISFIADDAAIASSLSPANRDQLIAAYRRTHWTSMAPFDIALGDTSFRSCVEPLIDPSSGSTIGATVIQSSLADGQALERDVSRSLLGIMSGGVLAGALVSFLFGGAINKPVRELVKGVRRVADGDLGVRIVAAGKDELGQLAAAFNTMVEQLRTRHDLERKVEQSQAASNAKSQFLAHMSHEIRTPLNGVIGMTDLLLATELTEQQRRFGRLAKSAAESLTTVINDILDFSKIEAGKLEILNDDFNLQQTVEDVAEMMAHAAASRGIEIACRIDPDVPLNVRGDSDRLRQILINLTNNAIKFTQRGAVVVRVTAEPAAAGRTTVRFTVTDTGIGIPADRIGLLFKAFSQADASTTRTYGGTGLGLAISKQLAELMGGAIGVESEVGRGSTFWFTIVVENHEAPAAPSDRQRIDPRSLRVLIVDDNKQQLAVLAEQIGAWGLSVASCESGQSALAELARAATTSKTYHVAIIDSDMPDMDGFELATAVRADAAARDTLLIALLSLEADIQQDRLRSMGFAGHLTKPVRQSILFDTIMDAISAAKKQPSALPPEGPSKSPIPTAAPSPPRRILLAEDNEINRMVASEILRKAGYQCVHVPNGQLAVEAVRRETFDLVLMDCQMPVMDGFDATRAIRSWEQGGPARPPGRRGRVPIVALTANAMSGDRDRCLEAGMDTYASKPINPKQLLATIAALLRPETAGQKAA